MLKESKSQINDNHEAYLKLNKYAIPGKLQSTRTDKKHIEAYI